MLNIKNLLQQSWKNLWKVKIVWLFGILLYAISFLTLVLPRYNPEKGGVSLLIYPIFGFLDLILLCFGETGVIYIAYRTTNGETITLREAWSGVKKFVGRIILYTFLFGLVLFVLIIPCFCIIFFYTYLKSGQNSSPVFTLVFILFGTFSAMWHFPIIGIVANDWKVGESVKNAWKLFTTHLGILMLAGLSLAAISQIINIIIGIAVILLQNNFDISALGNLNFVSLYLSFPNNPLYLIPNTIVSIIMYTYNAFVFTLAYWNFSDASKGVQ